MDIEEIRALIERKEKILVRYFGGKSQGSERLIAPIAIIDDVKVRARCFKSDSVKTFFMDKIQRSDGSAVESLSPVAVPTQSFSNLYEVEGFYRDTLESLGWAVEVDNELRIHGYFKNGRIRRTPAASISFFLDLGEDIITDPERYSITDLPTNKRPWCVRAKGKKTTNFRELSKASLRFLEYVNDLTPTGM